ncbi:MAG: hypothetical protein GVY12_13380 [Bacteroidetes bacterium]|nr:hypothetical protein [Bacteroidota bacterium]
MAVLLAGCDDMGANATWAPFASPTASEVDATATAAADSAAADSAAASARAKAEDAVADDLAADDVPPRPFRTAAAPADAMPALIAATEPIAWVDTAWPAARPPEPAADVSTGEPAPSDSATYTEKEAAALIAEAAAVLDARTTNPADVSATATRQDTLVDNLSDEMLDAYEDPSLADDTSTNPPATDTPSTDTPDADPEPSQLSLDMVIDETRSTQGRDFYNIFYRNWQAPEGAMNYTVYVREQPGRGRGSVVEVRVNDEIAFRSQLQPRYNMIEQTAYQAVRYTQQFMQRVDVSRQIY